MDEIAEDNLLLSQRLKNSNRISYHHPSIPSTSGLSGDAQEKESTSETPTSVSLRSDPPGHEPRDNSVFTDNRQGTDSPLRDQEEIEQNSEASEEEPIEEQQGTPEVAGPNPCLPYICRMNDYPPRKKFRREDFCLRCQNLPESPPKNNEREARLRFSEKNGEVSLFYLLVFYLQRMHFAFNYFSDFSWTKDFR